MKPLAAGAMRHYLAIQERATTKGAYGEQADTWSDVAGGSVWMAIVPLNGRELLAAQQLNTAVSHIVQLRYDSRWADPVTMAKRRVYISASRVLNIHAAYNVDEAGTWIHLHCTEGMNTG